MSIETIMKLKVGDGVDAQKAQATITCTDGVFNNTQTITITDPEDNSTTFTQGTDFTGGSGDNALASEINSLINAISGLSSTVENNVVTITVDEAGENGNNWSITTNASSFFTIVNFSDGREADEPVDLELAVESDGNIVARLDDAIVFRVPFSQVFDQNKKTFEQNLRDFLRKAQC